VALFLGLYLGHVLGDFVFQPGRLVIAKRQRLHAVVLHSAIVTLCTALVLLGSLGQTWPALALAGSAHFAVEHLTIRARRSPGTSNITVFLLDQALHVVSLAIIAAVGRGTPATPVIGMWAVTARELAIACAVTTVAFGGSILVFEAQVALASNATDPDPILGFDAARVYGFAERGGALLAALLLPSPLLGLIMFAPRLGYASFGPAERRRSQLAALGVGLAICVVAWTLVSAVGA